MFSRTGFYSFHYHFNIYSSLCCGRQHIKKQRHYFANKGTSSQSYGFSSSHVWMWELDHKESWALNWCFWTVVLEKTLERPLDCKEIKPVNPEEISPEYSLEGLSWSWSSNTLATWSKELTHWQRLWCWERLKSGGEGDDRDEVVGWHYRLKGREFEPPPGVGDGQGTLACCSPWGCKESEMTEQPNWTKDYGSCSPSIHVLWYSWCN